MAITKHTALVFYLGFSGIDLNMSDVNSILENTNRLILLEMSSFDHNWKSFRDLRNQYDVCNISSEIRTKRIVVKTTITL